MEGDSARARLDNDKNKVGKKSQKSNIDDFIVVVVVKVSTEASDVKWERASNLFPEAQLVVEDSSKDDVNQGRLGNCWFLCALVGAATRPHIFKKLVPKDQVT